MAAGGGGPSSAPVSRIEEEVGQVRISCSSDDTKEDGRGGGGYSKLLTPSARENAKTDAARFRGAVEALRSVSAETLQETLPWVSVFNSFLTAKGEYDIPDVSALAGLITDILARSGADTFLQIRWGSVLCDILRLYRYKLRFSMDWRLLHRLLCAKHLDGSRKPEGQTLTHVHAVIMTRLARRSRRFYTMGTSTEVWETFRAGITSNVASNAALESLGFFALFMPVHGIGYDDGRWNEWLNEWIEIWSWVPSGYCRWWSATWMDLFARIAKHDVENVIDWSGHLNALLSNVQTNFEIPIGSSSGASPLHRTIPTEVYILFNFRSGATSRLARLAAKLLVYLLTPQNRPHASDGLRQIHAFLENYYHPSNGGGWTASLAVYLKHLGLYLRKKTTRDSIPESELIPIVQSVARLATRAQFSKSSTLSKAGMSTMACLAQMRVYEIAPLIVECFQEALETDTAMHQLTIAITSLSRAARPILQAAEASARGDSDVVNSGSEGVDTLWWTNVFKDALVITLPGIDANDPLKTTAVLELYASVLSNVRILDDDRTEAIFRPSIGWQQWTEEFFDRIFMLLTNLNSPSHTGGADDSQASSEEACTFLWNSASFFSPLMGLLLSRMPPPMLTRTIERIASFLMTNQMFGMVPEMGVMAYACSMTDQFTTSRVLVDPMCEAIEKTLVHVVPRGVGVSNMSKTLEDTLEYKLAILRHTMYCTCTDVSCDPSGPDIVLQHLPRIVSILKRCLNSRSLNIISASGHFLETLMLTLVHARPLNTYVPCSGAPGNSCTSKSASASETSTDIDEWVTRREIEEFGIVEWREPLEAHLSAAKELLRNFIGPSLDAIESWERRSAKLSSDETKFMIRGLLWTLDGCLSATTAVCDPNCFTVSCGDGASVLDHEMRVRISRVLASFADKMDPDDNETMHTYIRLVANLVLPGTPLFDEFMARRSEWRADVKVMSQSVVDSFAVKRPRWLHVERIRAMHQYRASQMHYRRPTASSVHGDPPHEETLRLINVMYKLSLHPYHPVRKSAQIWTEIFNKAFPMIVPDVFERSLTNLRIQAGSMEKGDTVMAEMGSDAAAPTELKGSDVGSSSTRMRAEIEGATCGVASILTGRSMTRYMAGNGARFSSAVLVLCGLYRLDSVDSTRIQTSLQTLFLTMTTRFSTFTFQATECESLVQAMLTLSKESGNRMHWRFLVLINSFITLLIHETGAQIRAELMVHFFDMLKNPSPVVRPLALTGISLLLRRHTDLAETESLRALKEELCSRPDRWNDVVDSIAHVHGDQGTGGGGGGRRSSGTDQNVVNYLIHLFSLSRDWPHSRLQKASSMALGTGDFVILHARSVKRLLRWCGAGAIEQLRPKLEEMIQSKEISIQNTAAEVFGGLLRSRVVTVDAKAGGGGGGEDAWYTWIAGSVRVALRDTPVRCVSSWCASLRYCVKGNESLLEGARGALVELLFEPIAESDSSNHQMRRLFFFNDCLGEIGGTSVSSGALDSGAETFKERLITALESLTMHASRQVRESAGKCLSQVNGIYRHPVLASDVVASKVAAVPSASRAEALITTMTTNAKLALSVLLAERDAASMSTAASEPVEGVFTTTTTTVDGLVVFVKKDELAGGGGSATGLAAVDTWDKDKALACLETVLYFVVSSVRSGDSIALSPLVTSILPIIVRIQETPNQVDFSVLAKTALAFLKRHTIPASDLQKIIDGLIQATRDASWHTRAAALSFLQVLWYRHFFLLPDRSEETKVEKEEEGGSTIVDTVLRLLRDEQLEVRELAASTLAGVFIGMESSVSDSLRAKLMDDARTTSLEARRLRKRARSQNGGSTKSAALSGVASTTLMHAAALSLGACIKSSPYEMPHWLPACVCLFTDFSTSPSPVRDTVNKVLGEFWRTHTDRWHKEKNAFTADELDILSACRNSPHYYS